MSTTPQSRRTSSITVGTTIPYHLARWLQEHGAAPARDGQTCDSCMHLPAVHVLNAHTPGNPSPRCAFCVGEKYGMDHQHEWMVRSVLGTLAKSMVENDATEPSMIREAVHDALDDEIRDQGGAAGRDVAAGMTRGHTR